MKVSKYLLCLAFVLMFSSLSFASDIRIGIMCPMTGPWASEGVDMQRTISLLADDVNAKGGINGNKIVLVTEDDAGDPRTAALAAQKLGTSDVVAVIGTYGSAITEAAQNILDEAELVQIATGATSIRLTEKDMSLFFRTCPRDDAQGKEAAKILKAKNFKSVAILHDNSSYAKGLAEETRDILDDEGIKIVFYDAITPKERDYNATLTKIKSANPDVIFFTGYYNDAATLLRQKMEMGYNVPMIGGDATNNMDLVKIAGKDAAKGFLFLTPPVPQDFNSKMAQDFLASYKAKHTNLPSSVWSILAGDAFNVIVAALKGGATTSEEIAKYLKKDLKDFNGLSGAIAFDEKGDRVGDLYKLYVVDANGNFVLSK